jgi:hypothetical protein
MSYKYFLLLMTINLCFPRSSKALLPSKLIKRTPDMIKVENTYFIRVLNEIGKNSVQDFKFMRIYVNGWFIYPKIYEFEVPYDNYIQRFLCFFSDEYLLNATTKIRYSYNKVEYTKTILGSYIRDDSGLILLAGIRVNRFTLVFNFEKRPHITEKVRVGKNFIITVYKNIASEVFHLPAKLIKKYCYRQISFKTGNLKNCRFKTGEVFNICLNIDGLFYFSSFVTKLKQMECRGLYFNVEEE